MALVNIYTIQDGKLDSVADSSNAASHWVTILDVTETFNGETLVRVYNPYYNQEEIYTWETFSEAWADTEGNTYTHYGLVVADPTS